MDDSILSASMSSASTCYSSDNSSLRGPHNASRDDIMGLDDSKTTEPEYVEVKGNFQYSYFTGIGAGVAKKQELEDDDEALSGMDEFQSNY